MGCEVHAAASPSTDLQIRAEVDEFHPIHFSRGPLSVANFAALRNLVRVVRSCEFDLIHCHTPAASALTRLAGLVATGRPRVIYTVHGFHFFPNAPIRNWLFWFTTEFVLARATRGIITINRWDEAAANRLLRARDVRYIPGIGVDTERFRPAAAELRSEVRKELGLSESALVVMYVAEFIPRKNHRLVLEAFAELLSDIGGAILLLPGDGPHEPRLRALAQDLGIGESVRFLGFRRDIPRLAAAADMAVSGSRHEGLPIGVAELMASGVPAVVSEDRGHCDLVEHGRSGYIFPQDDREKLVGYLRDLARAPELRKSMGREARTKALGFGVDASVAAMGAIYRDFGVGKR
jgi:glycosyltransferase EpsD